MWGKFKQKVEGQAADLGEMKDLCIRQRAICTTEMCKKLDTVTDLIREESRRREEDRESHIRELIEIKKDLNTTNRETARFTGKVEEFMETVKPHLLKHFSVP